MTEPAFLERYRAALRDDVERRDADRARCASSCSIRKPPGSIRAPIASSRSAPSRCSDGEIVLEDSFDALLKVEREHRRPSTVHGITRDESRGGLDGAGGAGAVPRLPARRRDRRPPHRPRHRDARRGLRAALGRAAAEPQPRHDGPDAAPRAGRRVRRAPADPPASRSTRCATMFGVIPHDRHTATRRRLHHRAGVPAPAAPGRDGRPAHARGHHASRSRSNRLPRAAPAAERQRPARSRRSSTGVSAAGRPARPRRGARLDRARRAGPSTLRRPPGRP